MSNEQRTIAISTIPIPKLTVVMNNFICNTINHLNKLSVKGDEKLAEFDKKLNDLEIMTTLLEAKLNSLPEKITSTYPQLEPVSLDDISPVITNPISSANADVGVGSGSEVPNPPPPQPDQAEDDKKDENVEQTSEGGEAEEGGDDLPPEEALENFLKSHENFRNISKMVKFGVPRQNIEIKAKASGFDMDLVQKVIDLASKAYGH